MSKHMKPFIFNRWHVWQGTAAIMLSDEDAKALRSFASTDACVSWLYMTGNQDAARALNAHVKATNV